MIKRKNNLLLAGILLGGITSLLPWLLRVMIFTGAALILFVNYDEWDYKWRRRTIQ